MQEERLPDLPYLSEENRRAHLFYRNTLAARLSLWKKCFPKRASLTTVALLTAPLSKGEEEGRAVAAELLLHDVAFSSAAVPRREVSRDLLGGYASDAGLRYAMREAAGDVRDGFLCVGTDRRGRVSFCFHSFPWRTLTVPPTLAVDLAEHAYFYDYGFSRERYLAAAIAALDLSKLSE